MSSNSNQASKIFAKPAFLISIDTEEDNAWAQLREVSTRNADYLERFQLLCERFGLLPTYLVNDAMAQNATFVDLGKQILRQKTAEIGMHMHAWNTEPLHPLGPHDWYDQPYAFEYPPEIVARKAETVTRRLEDVFQTAVTSHRAGRWGFDAAYARSLIKLGYKVDCSVTPLVNWAGHPGLSGGQGGADFRLFPPAPYRLDAENIGIPGTSPLLEVPMTIIEGPRPWHKTLARRLLGRTGKRVIWLRPNGRNLADMIYILDEAVLKNVEFVQFTLHSSEFMPGGSPTFTSDRSIETLYEHMEQLFEHAAGQFTGKTLSGFAADFVKHSVVVG